MIVINGDVHHLRILFTIPHAQCHIVLPAILDWHTSGCDGNVDGDGGGNGDGESIYKYNKYYSMANVGTNAKNVAKQKEKCGNLLEKKQIKSAPKGTNENKTTTKKHATTTK